MRARLANAAGNVQRATRDVATRKRQVVEAAGGEARQDVGRTRRGARGVATT